MSPTGTAVVVPMPHMGVSVEEGTVIEWRVAVGEEVVEGDLICEVATDKVDIEVTAPAAGTVTRLLAAAGETVAVGEPLAELGGEGSAGEPSSSGEDRSTAPNPKPEAEAPVKPEGVARRAAAGRDEHGRFDPDAAAEAVTSLERNGPLASPLARRVAAERGVELAAVAGSGRGGRIRKADVLAAAAAGPLSSPGPAAARRAPAAGAPQAAPGSAAPALDGHTDVPPGYEGVPHEVVPTTRVRRAIAEHMIRSRQTAAHMTTEVDVDLKALIAARAELNAARLEGGGQKLSFLPFIARATCSALAEHPDMNATFGGERTIRWSEVNLGIAVDTPAGLLVPVLRNCGTLTAPAIGAAIADLADRARDRKLLPDDLAGGTFTISNPGSVGAVSAPAIINQPQVAILGIPAIVRKPWVIAGPDGEETIAIRSILRLAVTFDHRAVDGADATRFAVAVKTRLESWPLEAYA